MLRTRILPLAVSIVVLGFAGRAAYAAGAGKRTQVPAGEAQAAQGADIQGGAKHANPSPKAAAKAGQPAGKAAPKLTKQQAREAAKKAKLEKKQAEKQARLAERKAKQQQHQHQGAGSAQQQGTAPGLAGKMGRRPGAQETD